MKIKSHTLVAALSAAAVVVIPNVAHARGHGGGGIARSSMTSAMTRPASLKPMSVRTPGLSARASREPGNDRGRGRDDGPRHNVKDVSAAIRAAGADDPAGHDAGDDRGRGRGRGRGKDDGVRHNVNDARGARRIAGVDGPVGHDAGDDRGRHRRGRGH
jgi:hypothetical protein